MESSFSLCFTSSWRATHTVLKLRRDVMINCDSICYLGIKDGPQDCLVLP
ncbi:hypothetical protein PVAP13_2KG270000 [Panicum virgatum]|uniref:Uncharacterized protein n=1 Tax=Panicum virgatum TaxID=38727 RepID=A0A8T0WG11_PANVG|nr:hypothetical protein PVAP13_2KG270000 [Panicum virgatum]